MTTSHPPRWAVGQLRAALAEYPDDMPLQVAVPGLTHPDLYVDEDFVVTGAGIGSARWEDERGTVPNDYLTIELYPLTD